MRTKRIYIHPKGYASPLFAALGHGRVDEMRALLGEGAATNQCDQRGWPALAVAAWLDGVDLVRVLLEAGADPNIRVADDVPDVAGQTPIFFTRSFLVLESLLRAGADPNSVSSTGLTTLRLAITEAEEEHVRLLLAYGVKVPEEMKQPRYWTQFGRRMEPARRAIFAHLTATSVEDAMGGSDVLPSNQLGGVSPL